MMTVFGFSSINVVSENSWIFPVITDLNNLGIYSSSLVNKIVRETLNILTIAVCSKGIKMSNRNSLLDVISRLQNFNSYKDAGYNSGF